MLAVLPEQCQVHHFLIILVSDTSWLLVQVPGDMLERHSKICWLLDEANDQVMSVDARLTQ